MIGILFFPALFAILTVFFWILYKKGWGMSGHLVNNMLVKPKNASKADRRGMLYIGVMWTSMVVIFLGFFIAIKYFS